jgi:hypothetical protein
MERFDGWFVKPIEKLKELPEGDGGFLALSAALFLCERYYRTRTNTHERSKNNELFKVEAAKDLGVGLNDFKCFWSVYRHGLQHQGMPQRHEKNQMTYKWHMDESFEAVPTIHVIDARTREIRIDPWKFAALIVSKFKADPAVLANATQCAFGKVVPT